MLLENGLEACTCRKKDCIRHGNCPACLEYHQGTKRPPYCKRRRRPNRLTPENN